MDGRAVGVQGRLYHLGVWVSRYLALEKKVTALQRGSCWQLTTRSKRCAGWPGKAQRAPEGQGLVHQPEPGDVRIVLEHRGALGSVKKWTSAAGNGPLSMRTRGWSGSRRRSGAVADEDFGRLETAGRVCSSCPGTASGRTASLNGRRIPVSSCFVHHPGRQRKRHRMIILGPLRWVPSDVMKTEPDE